MLNNTWLVQRLNMPLKDSNFINPFNPSINSIPEKALKLLQTLFTIDYMGAAEFEFGAIPKSLSIILSNEFNFIPFRVTLEDKYTCYVYCKEEVKDEVVERVKELFKKNSSIRLKEYSNFRESYIKPVYQNTHYQAKTIGWLELDNNFFIFKTKELMNAWLKLIGKKEIEE